jgi:hypothetical protein
MDQPVSLPGMDRILGSRPPVRDSAPREQGPFGYPQCTPQDIGPYLALDHEFRGLQSAQRLLRPVSETHQLWFPKVEDVTMDDSLVIRTRTGDGKAIGTAGLGPCIAICGRSDTDVPGEYVFAVDHYSGRQGGNPNTAQERICELAQEMRDQGAVRPRFWLVGGMIMPLSMRQGQGSYESEKDLLNCNGVTYSGNSQIEIAGFDLHKSTGKFEDQWFWNAQSQNVVQSEAGIFYRNSPLYDIPPG